MEAPLLEERPPVIDSSDWLTLDCLDWGRWRDKSGKRYIWLEGRVQHGRVSANAPALTSV